MKLTYKKQKILKYLSKKNIKNKHFRKKTLKKSTQKRYNKKGGLNKVKHTYPKFKNNNTQKFSIRNTKNVQKKYIKADKRGALVSRKAAEPYMPVKISKRCRRLTRGPPTLILGPRQMWARRPIHKKMDDC